MTDPKLANSPFKNLTKEHENKWVAISSTDYSVLSSGDTLTQVNAALSAAQKALEPIIFKALPRNVQFAPTGV